MIMQNILVSANELTASFKMLTLTTKGALMHEKEGGGEIYAKSTVIVCLPTFGQTNFQRVRDCVRVSDHF